MRNYNSTRHPMVIPPHRRQKRSFEIVKTNGESTTRADPEVSCFRLQCQTKRLQQYREGVRGDTSTRACRIIASSPLWKQNNRAISRERERERVRRHHTTAPHRKYSCVERDREGKKVPVPVGSYPPRRHRAREHRSFGDH